jgi:hypothetical protein
MFTIAATLAAAIANCFSRIPSTVRPRSHPANCVPVEELALSSSILAFRGLTIRRHLLSCTPPLPASLSEYLSALPSWDCRLLQHVELPDAQALTDYLLTDGALFVVSDGGASDERGAYGAVLATADAILVKISGSTEGALPGSFRAESYGCLAILRFLYHFRRYNQLDPILCRNNFYCDNKGLITRLTFAAGPLSPFPRHYLQSNIDLEMQILDTIRLLGIDLHYHHVKGHQDSAAAPKTPLSRQAQLNVECDLLATAALHTARPSPLVTYLPASKVAVIIPRRPIDHSKTPSFHPESHRPAPPTQFLYSSVRLDCPTIRPSRLASVLIGVRQIVIEETLLCHQMA